MIRSSGLRAFCLAAATVALWAPSAAFAATSDPAGNRSLSQTTMSDCAANPSGSACISSALADINAARASEGVRPMVLPTSFASMSVPVQLLNLANLERVDRGLAPILGLSAALDQDAQAAAPQDTDPMPTHLYGNAATSNWAGGISSALEADFEWMYDDGPGSGNLDCTSSNHSGCWGHRDDILWAFSSPIVMGAGYATGAYGPSMTELFVGGDTKTAPGQPDAPIVKPTPSASAASTSPAPGAPAAARGNGHSAGSAPHISVTGVTPARGAVIVNARCAGAKGRRCSLQVTISVAGGSHKLGPEAFTAIRTGHRKAIRITLDRAAKRLLAARRTLTVHVVVKQRGSSAAPVSYTLTLRPSR